MTLRSKVVRGLRVLSSVPGATAVVRAEVALPGPPPDLRVAWLAEGLISVPEARLLQRWAAAVDDGCIVEVGSFRGRSTIVLREASPEGTAIFAIEPHEHFVGVSGRTFGAPDRAEFFRAMLRSGAYADVRLVNLTTGVVAPGWSRPVGLLWIDGDHSYEAVRADLDGWSPHLTPTAPVLLDDSDVEGVRTLIEEMTTDGWRIDGRAGKVTALVRAGPGAPPSPPR